MRPRRLLYLSAHQMTAHLWRAGELVPEGQFPATEIGHDQFSGYLAEHLDSVFSILANVAEEGFHVETIPFLQGRDRQAVIARKLEQQFFNASLTASQSLGYTKDKRKDERLLLAALTNNEFFAPWLNVFSESGVALSGIYSLPLMTPTLLEKIGLADEHSLLLSVQDQSIRQGYFCKGELHFSRLTPLHNSSIVGIAQAFSSESRKLQQYLTSQRLIGRNQVLNAHILAHPGAHKAILSSCTDTPTLHYNLLDIDECAKKTRLAAPPADSHCESLFLNLLATAPPRIQFANDDLRHGYHLGLVRSGVLGFGAAVLSGCLLFSGKLLFDTYTTRQESAALRTEANLSGQRYDEIAKAFPSIPTDYPTLRRIIDRYVELSRSNPIPSELYIEISKGLQTVPAIELESIHWQHENLETGPPPLAGRPQATPRASDKDSAVVRGILRLDGKSNPRQVLDAFKRLVDALEANPKLRVEILKRPFDIESGKSLKGGDILLKTNQPRSFSLRILRKAES